VGFYMANGCYYSYSQIPFTLIAYCLTIHEIAVSPETPLLEETEHVQINSYKFVHSDSMVSVFLIFLVYILTLPHTIFRSNPDSNGM
jgi:hypothetical protein